MIESGVRQTESFIPPRLPRTAGCREDRRPLAHLRLVWGCVVAFSMAAIAAAADAQPSPNADVSETIDVRVVNVEVVVTDRQGVRVQGLGPEDFRLTVDGEEVPVEFFTEVRGGRAVDGGARDSILAPGEALGTSYLLFIDEFFTLEADRQPVLRRLSDDLARLEPGDRMAIVAWNGRTLEMLSSWSSSSRQLGDVLAEAMRRRSRGLERRAELRQLDQSLVLTGRGDSFLDAEERAYVDRLTFQLEGVVGAARATLRSFARPPGRKVMLLVSGGWPFVPANFVNDSLFDFDHLHYDGGEAIWGSLAKTANTLGYSLYPIDAPGFEELDRTDASRAGLFSRRFTVAFLDRELELHATLDYLADETGGRALLNGQRGRVLEEVYNDTRSFYWMGFSPQRRQDDRYHDIEVEVRRPKLRIRAREGYQDLSRETEVAMAVESTLLFGDPAGAGDLEVEWGSPRRAGRGKIEVALLVQIPADEITLVPEGDDAYRARLELRLAALDGRGGRSDIPNIPIELRTQGLPHPGESLNYSTTLRMRRRPHEVVVAIYDRGSGNLLSAETQIGP